MPVGIIVTLLVLVCTIVLSGREIHTIIQREEEQTYYCGLCGRMMRISHFPH